MYFRMAVLILGIFCVGTAELSPSGMLGELSRDLSVTIPTAGLMVTVYALTVVVGGPIVTAVTTRIPRKYLLMLLLLVSVLGNVLCALAPTFAILLVGRMIAAIIHGTFLAVCVVTASSLASAEKRGSAVAGTQLGVNLATVLGVPLGTLMAQQINWRATFGSVAVLALITCVMILIAIPANDKAVDPTSVRHEIRAFTNWQVTGTVLATVLCSGGMFTVITYMVPLLTDVSGFPAAWVPAVLLAYGGGSIAGNFIGGRLANRSVEATVGWLSWALTAACVLFWIAAPSAAGSAAFLVLFSIATFALIPGLQVRILATAADAPTLSLTVNMAAFALGAAVGSWAGGQVIATGLGLRAIALAAAAFSLFGALVIAQVVYAARDRTGSTSGETSPAGEDQPVSLVGSDRP
ncbi:MFS transporter, DHA1 family, inner membrane transport protein [Cryobacterium luteum]|uniref:MFS transporter n=2 Tax=Cryobacterium luteum TaxID=1424661 RepID=A0A1H8MJJ8_9MICO|nr:MFS transporter [Cryobacterium luteum]SEO17575.1 MFS transporter, DHA1 family, inner membrane transport protein [Cryobacterium luteum]